MQKFAIAKWSLSFSCSQFPTFNANDVDFTSW